MMTRIPTLLLIASMSLLCACVAGQPPVLQELDPRTSVTTTRPRTPLIMSPDVHYSDSAAREYVQIGVIEVNRMGSLEYFLWLGIWDLAHVNSDAVFPDGFETIKLLLDGDTLSLDILSWSHDAIGTSERSYKKIFDEDVDAYYRVTLEQLRLLSDATDIKLRTTSSAPREFVPWYNQEKADSDLAEFVTAILF